MSDASKPEPTKPPQEDERLVSADQRATDETEADDELMSDEDYAALMEAPTAGELGILADTDVPGAPG
jgi:hypothetical protein